MFAITTATYAALLGILFFVLSVRIIILRYRHQVSLGDGDNKILRRAIRAHANFIEYTPFILLLIFFAELQGGAQWLLHLLGAGLLLGRTVHAAAISRVPEVTVLRVAGMTLTFAVLLLAVVVLAAHPAILFNPH